MPHFGKPPSFKEIGSSLVYDINRGSHFACLRDAERVT